MSSDWYKYLQPSTDVVSYAWNAAIVCVPCVDEAMNSLSGHMGLFENPEDVPVEEKLAAYALAEYGASPDQMGDLDTNDFPQPVTAGDEGADDDSCDRCLKRIKDTY